MHQLKNRIWIVDDNMTILLATKLLLEDEGYTVRTMSRRNEILKGLKKEIPDVILLDILLSGEDGREIIHVLKNDKKTKAIPVVLVSAYPNIQQEYEKYGADAFLPKPFEIDQLLDIIASLISVKAAALV